MAKFDPFLSLDCARVEGVGPQSKERKGSNFAIWLPCALSQCIDRVLRIFGVFLGTSFVAGTILDSSIRCEDKLSFARALLQVA